MDEFLVRLKNIVLQFKKIEEDEKQLNNELLKVEMKQDKLESAYTKLSNNSQENSIIIEHLDNDITILNEIRNTVNGYKEFKTNKKQKRILQFAFVIGLCGGLTSPLILIEPIIYLEFMVLSTTLMGLSNLVNYFNDIKQIKELVKSNDIDKLINNINKRERQKEIAECISIKYDVKKLSLTNEIENLDNEKEQIINHLTYLDNCKMELIEQLSKEFENTLLQDYNQLDYNDLHIKTKTS